MIYRKYYYKWLKYIKHIFVHKNIENRKCFHDNIDTCIYYKFVGLLLNNNCKIGLIRCINLYRNFSLWHPMIFFYSMKGNLHMFNLIYQKIISSGLHRISNDIEWCSNIGTCEYQNLTEAVVGENNTHDSIISFGQSLSIFTSTIFL